MSEPNSFEGDDSRIELTSTGSPILVQHETKGTLTSGLATWATLDGRPLATVNSRGPNTSQDHEQPKQGNGLMPLPGKEIRVMSGSSLLSIDGRPVATTSSSLKVPDVISPVKRRRLKEGQDWFTVDGEPVVLGEGS